MAKQLLRMATDENVSDAVKLAAIRDALDRAGLSPKAVAEVEVTLKPYEEMLAGVAEMTTMTRAESRAARGLPDDAPLPGPRALEAAPARQIIDAEVVQDDAERRPPWAGGASAGPGGGNGYMTYEQAQEEIARSIRERFE